MSKRAVRRWVVQAPPRAPHLHLVGSLATDAIASFQATVSAGDAYRAGQEWDNAVQAYQAAGQSGATYVGPTVDQATGGASAPLTQQAWQTNGRLAAIPASGANQGQADDAARLAYQMLDLYHRALAASAAPPPYVPPSGGSNEAPPPVYVDPGQPAPPPGPGPAPPSQVSVPPIALGRPWWQYALLAVLGGVAAIWGVRRWRLHSLENEGYGGDDGGYARATFDEFDRPDAAMAPSHAAAWGVGLGVAAAAGVAGYLVWKKGKEKATAGEPNPQAFWTTLTPVQQAAYQQGLYNWTVQKPQEWPAWVQPAGLRSPADLADPGNLAIVTDAFQTARALKVKSPGVVDAATFNAVTQG